MSIKRLYNTDESIIEGVRAAEDGALKALYKQVYPMVRNLILKNNGQEEDTQDILQDAMIVFYEKVRADNFIITCTINTFLYAVCRNLWLKKLKKESFNVSFNDTHETIEITNQIEDENKLNEKQKALLEGLQELGDPCRSILTYFYFEQFSMEKIARMLNYTNADNAKTQKYKCIKRLKKIMAAKMKGYLLE